MNPDYSNFDCHDFASDEAFQNWVLKPDDENNLFWEEYLTKNTGQINIILDARELVSGLKEIAEIPDLKKTSDQIWANIQEELKSPFLSDFSAKKTLRFAASLAILISFSLLIFKSWDKSKSLSKIREAKEELVFTNDSQEVKTIVLPDESKITLSAKSKLSYGNSFNQQLREVHLEGKAFFDITPNPQKPFLVFTDDLVTKVLGTSFTISAYDNEENVKVIVKTGRVSVQQRNEYEQSQNKENLKLTGLILTPNQAAIFEKNASKLNKTLVENPVIIEKRIKKFDFNFEEAPMTKVFQTLKSAYGIEIIFDNDVFSHCSLSVSLDDEDLFEKLNIICKTIGAKYQIIDSQIVISGKGCIN